MDVGPYSNGSDFDCRIHKDITQAYVYEAGKCYYFDITEATPPPCSHVYHEHIVGDEPRVYHATATGGENFDLFDEKLGECSWYPDQQ